jgi:hypothetical protein
MTTEGGILGHKNQIAYVSNTQNKEQAMYNRIGDHFLSSF